MILTTEIAERFLKDNDSVDLSEFTSIEEAAAQALAKHEGSLCLKRLESLSIAAAASLAKVNPLKGERNYIQLHSLSLTPEVAAQLAEYRGDQLSFRCTSVDLSTIQAFRPFGGQLWLGYVTHLDDKTATELASRSGGAYLDGLTVYNAEPGTLQLAQSLCKWNGASWLGLRGAKNIAPEAMAILATFDGKQILASPQIVKQIKAMRLTLVKASIRENRLSQPEEWQNGRIVLSKAPMKPLKGRNAERTKAEDVSWWLSKKVCSWFFQKLEDAHKIYLGGADDGSGRSAQISPEAVMLLREKADAWLWLMESEVKDDKAKEAFRIQSLATMKAPEQFKDGKVSLPAPMMPLAKAFYWNPDFEGEDYQSVLHYYDYLATEHAGSVEDPNGYQVKAMSPEAAHLYRGHRAFWEAKYAESKAQAKIAIQVRKQEADQSVEKAAKVAGLSRKELEAKLKHLSEMVAQGNLKLVADMIAGFGESWLYEALLAGASINPQGDQTHGKVLKRFGEQAELIMVLAMAFMPEGVQVDPSIFRDAVVKMSVTGDNVDVVAEMISPHLSGLKPELSRSKPVVERLDSLTKLLPPAAELLARLDQDLYLVNLETLGIQEAMSLSKLEGDLHLDGIKQLDEGVAAALAKVKGKLYLEGLSTVTEAVARALASHVGGLRFGFKDLLTPVAAGLAYSKSDLDLPNLKTITAEAAAALASHSGLLELGAYAAYGQRFELSIEAAQGLSRHAGPLALPSLKRIDAETALALSELKHYIQLYCIDEFPEGVAGVRLCEKLALSPNSLNLRYLKHLQVDCAAALAAFKGYITLSVDEWTDDALIALAAHEGRLEVNLKRISDEVGRALGRRGAESVLSIPGAVAMTDAAAEALGAYRGWLILWGGIEVSKEAACHLVKRSRIEMYRSKLKPAVRKIFESAGSWSDSTWTRKT